MRPATAQARVDAVGRDIYEADPVRREILVLTAPWSRRPHLRADPAFRPRCAAHTASNGCWTRWWAPWV